MLNTQERIIGEREKLGMIEFSVGEIPNMNDYIPDKIDDMPDCRKTTD